MLLLYYLCCKCNKCGCKREYECECRHDHNNDCGCKCNRCCECKRECRRENECCRPIVKQCGPSCPLCNRNNRYGM